MSAFGAVLITNSISLLINGVGLNGYRPLHLGIVYRCRRSIRDAERSRWRWSSLPNLICAITPPTFTSLSAGFSNAARVSCQCH